MNSGRSISRMATILARLVVLECLLAPLFPGSGHRIVAAAPPANVVGQGAGTGPPRIVDASRYGARADDETDDAKAIQAALDAGGSVRLGKGRYVITDQLKLTADGQQLIGEGRDATTILARGDFTTCIRADDLTGVAIRDLTIDANRAARKALLTTRTLGIFLVNCRDAQVENCRVSGTIGGPATKGGTPMPGVGIAIGYGRRCLVADCLVESCGEKAEGLASDAIYSSGDFNVIRDCVAEACTDTAFVVEDSNYSGVVRCRADRCSAGLAITSARDEPARGNYADGISILDWDSAVTGGISIGCPSSNTRGDLLNTSLNDITIERREGQGPALFIRRTGAARVVGLSLREVRVRGAEKQGIIVDAERVLLSGCEVRDSGWTAIQVQEGARDVTIRGCQIANPRGFGISILGPSAGILMLGNQIEDRDGHMSWGIYCFDSTDHAPDLGNAIRGATVGAFGWKGKERVGALVPKKKK